MQQETINLKEQEFSFLGRGSKISGSFLLNGSSHLSGHIEGDITMGQEAHLCIEKHGKIIGQIKGHHIEVYGEINGRLEASGKVTVYPPAIIEGEIHSQQLIIHPGARIDCEIHTS